jgi:hypothetical protein
VFPLIKEKEFIKGIANETKLNLLLLCI